MSHNMWKQRLRIRKIAWIAGGCICALVMPGIGSAQQEVNVAEDPAALAAIAPPNGESATSDRGFVPSYGDQSVSLFLTPEQLREYLAVIRQVEERLFYGRDTAEESIEKIFDTETDVAIEGEETPLVYPYYHLSSVIYNNQDQWMVRVNGITLTHAQNTPDSELYVTAISPQLVSFVWKPQEERLFQDLILRLNGESQGLEEDAWRERIDHRRITRQTGIPLLSEEERHITFSLEPNQLFYSEYFTIYEGGAKEIVPPPPPPPPSEDGSMADGGTGDLSIEEQLLERNMSRFGRTLRETPQP